MSDQKKRTLKGGAGYFFSNVITSGLGFLFIAISSRVLGPAEFGVLSLGLSVIGIAANFGSFGLPNTIQRYLSGRGEDRANHLFGSILLLATSFALLFATVFFTASEYIAINIFDEPRLTIVLQVLSIGVALRIMYSILNAVLQAQEHIKQIVISKTTRSVCKIVFLGVVFLWVQNAVVAALAGILATFVASFYVISCIKKLDIKPNLPSKEDVKKVTAYSLPLVFVGFSYFLTQQTDRLMLGWLTTSSNVGIYTVVSTLALIMSTFHGSLVSIFLPLASQAYRNNEFEELNETYLFISKWVGGINGFVAIVFAGFGVWILTLFGPEYSNEVSYQILLLLSFLYFVGTWVGPTGALLQMSDGHRIEFYNTLVFVVLNIVLNYYFILLYGLAGAAIGTLISGLVRNTIQLIEIRYIYRLDVIRKENLVVLIYVLSTFVLCLFWENYRYFISLFSLACLPVYMYVKMDEFEAKLLRNTYKKYVG